MLLHSQRIREEVWQRLRTIFNGYTNGAECIGQEQLARLVQEVLREDTQRELDYVMLNLNRIDTDANGSIDFHEFVTTGGRLRLRSCSSGIAARSPCRRCISTAGCSMARTASSPATSSCNC